MEKDEDGSVIGTIDEKGNPRLTHHGLYQIGKGLVFKPALLLGIRAYRAGLERLMQSGFSPADMPKVDVLVAVYDFGSRNCGFSWLEGAMAAFGVECRKYHAGDKLLILEEVKDKPDVGILLWLGVGMHPYSIGRNFVNELRSTGCSNVIMVGCDGSFCTKKELRGAGGDALFVDPFTSAMEMRRMLARHRN